jgi:hypothetical protein
MPTSLQHRVTITAFGRAFLLLAASLLFGACSASDTGKNGDPTYFGGVAGGNGGGGATSGMSINF